MAGKGLQTVGGIGKTAKGLRKTGRFLERGNALPAGIAITDMIREIDDGKSILLFQGIWLWYRYNIKCS